MDGNLGMPSSRASLFIRRSKEWKKLAFETRLQLLSCLLLALNSAQFGLHRFQPEGTRPRIVPIITKLDLADD
jgi:hypothetical protein